jgi:hypothetical protein
VLLHLGGEGEPLLHEAGDDLGELLDGVAVDEHVVSSGGQKVHTRCGAARPRRIFLAGLDLLDAVLKMMERLGCVFGRRAGVGENLLSTSCRRVDGA